MTVFYQQSGTRGERDFIKTLAERDGGSLRFFTASTLKADYGFDAQGLAADGGFQIWGVPTGAKNIVRRMQAGDLVLLIGHLSPKGLEYGKFFYAGRVTYVLPREDFALSSRLWGDGGFPLIFFMQGALITYSWLEFAMEFKFKPTYYLAGQTMRVTPERLANSAYQNEMAFAARLGLAASSL
jgi:hypothetical protein